MKVVILLFIIFTTFAARADYFDYRDGQRYHCTLDDAEPSSQSATTRICQRYSIYGECTSYDESVSCY